MFVVLDTAAWGEVVGTDDAVVGQNNTSRRHAQVRGVIGNRAAHTSYQTTCSQHITTAAQFEQGWRTKEIPRNDLSVLWFTFSDVGAVGVGDEAGETDVDGAAESSVHRCRRGEVGDTLPVVKLPAYRNHTAPHILTALFTYEAGVDA